MAIYLGNFTVKRLEDEHSFVDDYFNIRTYEEYEIVDAAVEMILKLHEQKLL